MAGGAGPGVWQRGFVVAGGAGSCAQRTGFVRRGPGSGSCAGEGFPVFLTRTASRIARVRFTVQFQGFRDKRPSSPPRMYSIPYYYPAILPRALSDVDACAISRISRRPRNRVPLLMRPDHGSSTPSCVIDGRRLSGPWRWPGSVRQSFETDLGWSWMRTRSCRPTDLGWSWMRTRSCRPTDLGWSWMRTRSCRPTGARSGPCTSRFPGAAAVTGAWPRT